MGKFVVGDIVVVTFPFSDLTSHKVRPALVLAHTEFNNLILCQITSNPYASQIAIKLTSKDFKTGTLPTISYVRPDKLFTAEPIIIQRVAAKLQSTKHRAIVKQVQKQFDIV